MVSIVDDRVQNSMIALVDNFFRPFIKRQQNHPFNANFFKADLPIEKVWLLTLCRDLFDLESILSSEYIKFAFESDSAKKNLTA